MRLEHWWYAVPLRLRSLFQRRRVEDELDEELQFHLDRKIEGLIVQGLTPEAARKAALRSMDGLTQRKEECRDARGWNFIEHIVQDIRYALRVLLKSPGFTVVAIATLALAIGANAVVFGIFNGLLLRPLAVPRAESLWGTVYGEGSGWQSYLNYIDLRDRNRSFEELAAWNFAFVGLDTGKQAVPSTGYATTANYFEVLQVKPYAGRFFRASDDHGAGSMPYVVLTWAYWHAHFHDDRAVVGRTIKINKHPYTIIGVAPPEFRGTLLFGTPDFFMPVVDQDLVNGGRELTTRGTDHALFETFGHLKPGVTVAQAEADLNAVSAYLRKTYPKESGTRKSTLAHVGLTAFTRPVRAFVAGLMLLAGMILLAACANLGNLFAARAADRSRELALRLALGASRSRVVRALLTEAVLVALAGGAAGLWVSVSLLQGMSTWQPFRGAPLQIPVAPDARIYAVSLALALVSGLLFGIVPLRQVLRTDPYQIVKAGSSGPGRRITMRDLLLAAQIAICAVLVTSSLVALRGLARSMQSHYGFEPQSTVLASINLSMAGYNSDRAPAMQRRMIDALQNIPGVEQVGMVNNYPPLVYTAAFRTNIFKEDATDFKPANAVSRPYKYDVSPGYFRAAGTALVAGRDFSWHDDKDAPRVAVVNCEFARRMFGSVTGAGGRYFRATDGVRVQVVGIVDDGKYLSLTEDQEPAIFFPFQQSPLSFSHMIVRTTRDPQQIAAAMRRRIHELDGGLPVETQSWKTLLDVVLFPARAATMALGVLGGMGAMLSITGIFGMAAYSVSRRLKELGIRMAIGAQRREVLHAALGRALKVLALGSIAGLALGILASRVLASIVYQATPRDPFVLAAAVLVMSLLGLVATWAPAQRALSLDPLTLLREE